MGRLTETIFTSCYVLLFSMLISCSEKTPRVLSDEEIKPILTKNTCMACRKVNEKLIGSSFKDIAARNYNTDCIIELVNKPEPENWSDYTVPMALLTHIPKEELKQIAIWTNSLN